MSLRGHLATSGDNFGVTAQGDATGLQWVEAGDAAECPRIQKTAPTTELSGPKCQQCRLKSCRLDYCDCFAWAMWKEGPAHTLRGMFFLKELDALTVNQPGQERRTGTWPWGRENTVRRTLGRESHAVAYNMTVGDPWEKG